MAKRDLYKSRRKDYTVEVSADFVPPTRANRKLAKSLGGYASTMVSRRGEHRKSGYKIHVPPFNQINDTREKALADPGIIYTLKVLKKEIVAPLPILLAAERTKWLLDNGRKHGIVFSPDWVRHARDYFRIRLVIPAGKRIMQPFVTLPWMDFVLVNSHGFYYADIDMARTRRKITVLSGKASGKTPLGSAVTSYEFTNGVTPGAQAIVAANSMDQTGVPWAYMQRMFINILDRWPHMAPRIQISDSRQSNSISFTDKHGLTCRCIRMTAPRSFSGDPKGKSGHNVSFVHLEEIHETDNPKFIDWMEKSIKDEHRGMLFITTNAGERFDTPCGVERHRALEMLNSSDHLEDVHEFAAIYEVDREDDPFNTTPDKLEDMIKKANPGYPVQPTQIYIRTSMSQAKKSEGNKTNVRRLTFSQWGMSIYRWCDMHAWKKYETNPAKGRKLSPMSVRAEAPCTIGIDLSYNQNLTAISVAWLVGGRYEVDHRIFTAEKDLITRASAHNRSYLEYGKQGYLTITPGAKVDLTYPAMWIEELVQKCSSVICMSGDMFRTRELLGILAERGISHNIVHPNAPGIFWAETNMRNLAGEHKQKSGLWWKTLSMHTHLLAIERIMENPKKFIVTESPIMRSSVDAVTVAPSNGIQRIAQLEETNNLDPAESLIIAVGTLYDATRAMARQVKESKDIDPVVLERVRNMAKNGSRKAEQLLKAWEARL